VTTDNQEQVVDELGQDQQLIDQEQGITAEVSAEAINQQLSARMQALENQNRGLQSLIDSGLNAIRRDTETWINSQVGNLRGDLDRERLLSTLDEEQKPVVEALLSEMDRRMPATPVAQPSAPAQNGQQANGQQAIVDHWSPVMQYVETMGLSRNDSRVQYTLLANTNGQIDANKWATFRDHLINLYQQDRNSGTSPATPSQARQQSPATANPPVESPGATPVGTLNNSGDIQDAFIQGRFNSPEDPNGMQEYIKRMASIGEAV
jgi:hypothetical protein